MQIHHDLRAVTLRGVGDHAALGRGQQQVVAVHVSTVGGDPRESIRAIWVAARNDEQIHAFEQFGPRTGELLCQHQCCFATSRLVAMLLADDQHGGPTRVKTPLVGQQQERQGSPLLRQPERLDFQMWRLAGKPAHKGQHFGVRCKIITPGPKTGRGIHHRWCGVSRGNGGALWQNLGWVKLGRGLRSRQDHTANQ